MVFFDLDGTLTDPITGVARSIQYALERLGVEKPAQNELGWCIGPPLLESLELLVGKERAPFALKLYRERYSDVGWLENRLYPGVPETLATLSESGLVMNVATSKPEIYAQKIIEHFKLDRYFQTVFGADLGGARSNKVKLLQHALSATGSCASPVMIGDRKYDVIGALSNNMRAIGVSYGYGSVEELRSAGAAEIIGRPEDLLPLLL